MVPAARASSSSNSVHSRGPAQNASSRTVLLSLRRLFATPYQSSNATIEDSRITLSRATARWNRRRTFASLPLINAMHAFVSSRYVVIEHVSLWRRGLLPAFRHERLGGQTVEFAEPRRDVREHWLDEHASSGAANSDPIPPQT